MGASGGKSARTHTRAQNEKRQIGLVWRRPVVECSTATQTACPVVWLGRRECSRTCAARFEGDKYPIARVIIPYLSSLGLGTSLFAYFLDVLYVGEQSCSIHLP
jgi:hypothetical protein